MSRWLAAAQAASRQMTKDKTDTTDKTQAGVVRQAEVAAPEGVSSVMSVSSLRQKVKTALSPPRPPIPAGFIVFATGDCPEGRAEARAWIKAKGLTRQDVKGRIIGGQACLVALRPLWIAPGHGIS